MTEATDHLAFEPSAAVTPEPLAPPADCRVLAGEVRNLPASAVLARTGPLVAFLADADAVPHLLYEIGRLRERTFRAIGEGTGKRIDLDWFDSHYLHLVSSSPSAHRFSQTMPTH